MQASLVIPVFLVRSEKKRCEKLRVRNRARKHVGSGVVGGELADTCVSYRGLDFRNAGELCPNHWMKKAR